MTDFEHYLQVPYPPLSGNHQYAHGRGGTRLKPEMTIYRRDVENALLAQQMHGLNLPGPLWVEWLVNPPDDRVRDEDNLLKPVKDAITKSQVWIDDGNRVIRATYFRWGNAIPGGRVCCWIRNLQEQECDDEIAIEGGN